MFDHQGGLGGSQLGLESLMAEIHERRLRLIMRISFFIRDIYLITMIILTSNLIVGVHHPHWFCHQREECDRLTGMLELQKQHFKQVLCCLELHWCFEFPSLFKSWKWCLKKVLLQELEYLGGQLREESIRCDRLEEQMNDLTELHQVISTLGDDDDGGVFVQSILWWGYCFCCLFCRS